MVHGAADGHRQQVAREPAGDDNLWYVRYHPYHNRDNVRLLDEKTAVEELTRYGLSGGSSLVNMTNVGIGRDPLAPTHISRATGLSIVMGAGYYVEESLPAGLKMGEKEIARNIVRDIAVGVGDAGIRAGVIGAFINIHTGRSPSIPFEVVEFLDKAGADITRVVTSHIHRTHFYHEARVRLSKSGCFLEYDVLPHEG